MAQRHALPVIEHDHPRQRLPRRRGTDQRMGREEQLAAPGLLPLAPQSDPKRFWPNGSKQNRRNSAVSPFVAPTPENNGLV
ncbi:hypothetical protein [Rhodococcus sp. WB9]|uniref:hypothetical protein n=1 Tax=Rhodococcus sp. WB9 TaxID=2594007 RepID=UPI001C91AAB4|nr:hypothetical protein [Rhodococcus sp. WB9]